jgi:hypothetical protein
MSVGVRTSSAMRSVVGTGACISSEAMAGCAPRRRARRQVVGGELERVEAHAGGDRRAGRSASQMCARVGQIRGRVRARAAASRQRGW